MPAPSTSATLYVDSSAERVREVDGMTSDTHLRPALVEETKPDIDAIVAAVIRTHERVQWNLWRLAAERVWPVDGGAGTDGQVIGASRPGKRR
jgi:hypothetical protein